MPHYLDPRTNRYFIEFQLLGKRYKRRMPPDISESEVIAFEHDWRQSIIHGDRAPEFAAHYRGTRRRNGSDPGLIYILRCVGRYKIGRTANIKARLTTIQNASPFDVELVATLNVSRPGDLESLIHKQFQNKRLKGEWFDLNVDDVQTIIHLAEAVDSRQW